MEYLHNLNIVYRDVKPENSMVDSNVNILLKGKLILIDLGTAKHLENGSKG